MCSCKTLPKIRSLAILWLRKQNSRGAQLMLKQRTYLLAADSLASTPKFEFTVLVSRSTCIEQAIRFSQLHSRLVRICRTQQHERRRHLSRFVLRNFGKAWPLGALHPPQAVLQRGSFSPFAAILQQKLPTAEM